MLSWSSTSTPPSDTPVAARFVAAAVSMRYPSRAYSISDVMCVSRMAEICISSIGMFLIISLFLFHREWVLAETCNV